MSAIDKILNVLKQQEVEGILQSELPKRTNLSKSTVSETLSILERRGLVVRKRITKNSYRVWLLKYYPYPLKDTFRIGILKASEYPAVVIAAKKLNGVIEVFDNPIELTKSLCIGNIDIAASPLVTQLTFACLMKNVHIFRVVALNGSGIVVKKENCKKIGTTEMSTMELNLRRINENWSFVYFKSPEGMIDSLRKGEVDGIAIWEPYLTELSKNYEIIKFNELVGNFPCCSLAVNSKFLSESKAFNKFLKEFDKCCKKIELYKRKAAIELSKFIDFDYKLVEKSFSSFTFNCKFSKEDLLEFIEKETFLRKESILPFLRLPE